MVRKILLICGTLSSILYVGTDILSAMQYEGYSYTSQAVSELSAIGAPTRPLIVSLMSIYGVLILAFALGIWGIDRRKRALRITAVLLVVYVVAGQVTSLFFPMHLRGDKKTISDTMHKILTGVTVLFILLSIGFGANANGKWFRFYSIVTILVLILFGVWAGLDAPRIDAKLPTPWLGIKERINIYGYMLWVAVLAIILLQMKKGIGAISVGNA
jgi:hypothetical membrane protein